MTRKNAVMRKGGDAGDRGGVVELQNVREIYRRGIKPLLRLEDVKADVSGHCQDIIDLDCPLASQTLGAIVTGSSRSIATWKRLIAL
jgi:hypothetical protein